MVESTFSMGTVAAGITEAASTALAIIRAVSPDACPPNSTLATPNTTDWTDTLGGACVDLDSGSLKPLVAEDACTDVVGRVSLIIPSTRWSAS